MKKSIIFIIFGSLFSALGGFVGYFISKKKYLAIADKEIASMKSVQKQHDENLLKLYGVKPEIKKKSKPEPRTELTQEAKKPLAPNKIKQKYVDYTHEYAPNNGEKNPSAFEKKTGIILISESTFAESDFNYQSLQYYDQDKVVADMDDNCILQYLDLIGPSELWEKELKLDGQAVYIRNENSEMDYELLYKNDKWSDAATPTQKSAALLELNSNQDEDHS